MAIAAAGPGPGSSGFSLIELMVVLAIITILALGMVGVSRNPISDVKGAIFNLRSDIAYARAEAAKRNNPVTVEFGSDMDDTFSYRLCFEFYDDPANRDGDCADANADADEEEEDVMIKEVVFDPVVEFYDDSPAVNTPPGPNVVPTGTDNTVWPQDTSGDKDGLTHPENAAGNDYIIMRPDGSSDAAGVIYLYAPDPGDGGSNLRTPPLALTVAISGVTRIIRWDKYASVWTSK